MKIQERLPAVKRLAGCAAGGVVRRPAGLSGFPRIGRAAVWRAWKAGAWRASLRRMQDQAVIDQEHYEAWQKSNARKLGRVSVYIFKPSGKWYHTATVDMSAFHDQDNIHGCVRAACMAEAADPKGGWGLARNVNDYLRDGWTVVCPDPHHKHSHPVMLCGPQSLDQTPNFERR